MVLAFEGIDGVGKSTQIDLFKDNFADAIITKEPGGTKFGEHIREILLKKDINIAKTTEMFLFLADRAEHYEMVIKKNLDKLILSDRSFISGIAYSMSNKSDIKLDDFIKLNNIALQGFKDYKFIFLHIKENGLKQRLLNISSHDKIEQRGLQYLMNVQKHMEFVLNSMSCNFLKIDACEDKELIHRKIKEFIQ